MRDYMLHAFREYQDTDFMSSMLANLTVDSKWTEKANSIIRINEDRTDLVLDSDFLSEISSVDCLMVQPHFLQSFPEFSVFVQKAPEDPSTSTHSVSSSEDLREAGTSKVDVDMSLWAQEHSSPSIERTLQNVSYDQLPELELDSRHPLSAGGDIEFDQFPSWPQGIGSFTEKFPDSELPCFDAPPLISS